MKSHSHPVSVALVLLGGLLLWLSDSGCRRREVIEVEQPKRSVVDEMRLAAEDGEWELAWEHSQQALIKREHDPKVLHAAAQIALRTDRDKAAADLLVDACRAENFSLPLHVQQAFTTMVSVGRLFDGIEFVQEALQVDPKNSNARKMLFYFLIGTEQQHDAAIHGRQLVRDRDFDLDLLLALDEQKTRDRETKSVVDLVKRNPDDIRPLIGVAKYQIDRGFYKLALETLETVLRQHPHFVRSHLMFGRALCLSGRHEQLPSWTQRLVGEFRNDADYWLTLGDWSHANGKQAWASFAYGQAARLDSDRVEAWNKLIQTIPRDASFDTREAASIRKRATLLSQLQTHRAEFMSRGKDSATTLQEIAETLSELGRHWEAEAWTSVGLTFPKLTERERRLLNSTRGKTLRKLSKNSPWQDPRVMPSWNWLDEKISNDLLVLLSGDSNRSSAALARIVDRAIPIQLQNIAVGRGLTFFGRTADDLDQPGIANHQMLGCGGGTIDFDRDGWPDLYLISAGGRPPNFDSEPNAIFRNLDGQFAEVTNWAGGDDRGFGQGVAVGDVNEDGFDDLFVLNYGPNRLWLNNGDGTFSDQTDTWLPPKARSSATWSTSAAIADIDGDSISDLVVANYCAGLEPSTELCDADEGPGQRACSPVHFRAAKDEFLRGRSGGGFVDVTADWRAEPDSPGRGLGVIAGSLDQYPGIDVLIANDMTANHFWTSDQQSPFQLSETAALLGLATDALTRPQASMGIATSDFNHDGRIDFYVTHFDNEYNTLYLSNVGDGWTDMTIQADLGATKNGSVGFGTEAIDFDNNGEAELIVTNGHIDVFMKEGSIENYRQPMLLFQRNQENAFAFSPVKVADPYFEKTHVGRGLWTIDFDRDRRIDLVVSHQTEPVALLSNQTPSDYQSITIRLVATKSARNAIGAVVKIEYGPETTTTTTMTSGGGFMSSNEAALRVGLGKFKGAVGVSVDWPSGESIRYEHLEPSREWLIVEGEEPFEL